MSGTSATMNSPECLTSTSFPRQNATPTIPWNCPPDRHSVPILILPLKESGKINLKPVRSACDSKPKRLCFWDYNHLIYSQFIHSTTIFQRSTHNLHHLMSINFSLG